jgi:hypothetical protein
MKIDKIEQEGPIFTVYLKPTKFERFFGYKEKVMKLKDDNRTYMCGGGHIYVTQEGKDLYNGHWIASEVDKFRKKF